MQNKMSKLFNLVIGRSNKLRIFLVCRLFQSLNICLMKVV